MFTNCPNCGNQALISDEVCSRCSADLIHRNARVPWSEVTPYDNFRPVTTIEPYGGVGSLLVSTIQVFSQNFWFITKLVFVLFAPLELARILKLGGPLQTWEQSLGINLLGTVCTLLIAPSLTYGLFHRLSTGTNPTIHECYRRGISRLPSYFLVVLFTGVLIALGVICLVVPGIILTVAFVPVTPLATLETHGPVDTMKRSFSLTKGHRGAIFVGLLCLGVFTYLVTAVPTGLVGENLGTPYWPLQFIGAMFGDILDQVNTVFALVYYVSILNWRGKQI